MSNIEKTIEERQTLVHFLFPRIGVNNGRGEKQPRKDAEGKSERERERETEHSAANET